MKNALYHISEKGAHILKEQLNLNKNIYVADLDGRQMTTIVQFLNKITESFKFPIPAKSLDGYLDWIRDLSWINAQGYVLIIHNAKSFLDKEPNAKQDVLDDFDEVVFPWWQEDVEQFVVGAKAKSFNVYLID